MRPSSKNLVMNGIIESFTNQKSLDEAQSTSFANTWGAFNGEAITLGDLFIDETAFAVLSGLGCSFGAFNCHFKDGHRGNGLVWIKDGSLWAVEMLDEGSLPLHKISVDGSEEIIESDEKASGILSALICVENGGGGGTSENAVTIDTAQTITGSKTFKSPIKTNEIDNENGNALLRFKETEEKNVVGGSNYNLTLMGKGERPNYSNEGSDFEGKPLALKKDVDDNWNLLMANLGIGRWSNQTFYSWSWENNDFYDDLAPYYTNISRYMSKSGFYDEGVLNMMNDYPKVTDMSHAFRETTITELRLRNIGTEAVNATGAFAYASFTKIIIEDGCNIKIKEATRLVVTCPNLTEVGSFDMSEAEGIEYMFQNDSSLKSIHCKHWKLSFRIQWSSKFEEADLVEIISNLDTVTTTQTLTMGATNLAKLTDAEKKVATDKGWTLA